MAEPVDILIEKGTVLTLDGERRILTDGAIAIKGDRIAAVGKTADVRKKYEGKKTIDASTRLIMPGLVHDHRIRFRKPYFLRLHSDDRSPAASSSGREASRALSQSDPWEGFPR